MDHRFQLQFGQRLTDAMERALPLAPAGEVLEAGLVAAGAFAMRHLSTAVLAEQLRRLADELDKHEPSAPEVVPCH